MPGYVSFKVFRGTTNLSPNSQQYGDDPSKERADFVDFVFTNKDDMLGLYAVLFGKDAHFSAGSDGYPNIYTPADPTEIYSNEYHFALHKTQYNKVKNTIDSLPEFDKLMFMTLGAYKKNSLDGAQKIIFEINSPSTSSVKSTTNTATQVVSSSSNSSSVKKESHDADAVTNGDNPAK